MATMDYRMLGGGAGGGYGDQGGGGGGGGAGGHIKKTAQTVTAGTYAVVIGAGGSGTTGGTGNPTNGGDTTFNGDTASGGGRAGGAIMGGANGGGCGGGTAYQGGNGGTGTQGGNGGKGSPTGSPYGGAGGGGTTGTASNLGNSSNGGAGGAGTADSITGSSVTLGGGGGGGSRSGGGAGGSGGGGAGSGSGAGSNGTANTGGGGGGARDAATSGNGGSGIVIVRLLTADWATITGGSQATDGSYKVVTFNSSGDLILTAAAADPAPSVNDTVTVTENITLSIPLPVNVNDAIAVTESVTLSVSSLPTLNINVNDTVTVTENIRVPASTLYIHKPLNYDSNSYKVDGVSTTSISWTHTFSGSTDTILRVWVATFGISSVPVTGVTANGVAMTKIDSNAPQANWDFSLWELVGATSGTVVATAGSTATQFRAVAIGYTGASNTGSPDASAKNTAAANNVTATLTTIAGGAWVTAGSVGGSQPSVSTGVTLRVNGTGSQLLAAGDSDGEIQPVGTPGSYLSKFTMGGVDNIGIIVASIAPSPTYDAIAVTESVTISVSASPILNVNVFDTVTITENNTAGVKNGLVSVDMWGGGGGGGGGGGHYNGPGASGGGAGAYVKNLSYGINLGSYSVTVATGGGGGTSYPEGGGGTGGTGHFSGGNGSDKADSSGGGGGGGGGSSKFDDLIASGGGGGLGGLPDPTNVLLVGGSAASGSTGGAGADGTSASTAAGGGGGSATSGGNGSGTTPGAGGTGGSAQTGTNGKGGDGKTSQTLRGAAGGSSAGRSGNGNDGVNNDGTGGTGGGSGGAAVGTDFGGTGTAGTGYDSGGGGGKGYGTVGGTGGNPGAGGGGGMSYNSAPTSGGAGGGGKVIITYVTADFTALFWAATGGTITTDGANTVHTFTSSGTFTISYSSALTLSVFDAVTIVENVTPLITARVPSVFDTVTITENISLSIPLPVSVNDTVTITESITPRVVSNLSVNDSIKVRESWTNAIAWTDADGKTLTASSPWDFSANLQGAYSFLFKMSSTPSGNKVIFRPGTTRLDTNIEGTTGKLFVWFTDSTNTGNLVWKASTANQFVDGAWHRMIVNKTGTAITVYVDGTSMGSHNTTLKTFSTSGANWNGDNYTETLGETVIWKRALTTQEITDITTSNTYPMDNLAAFWGFDESSGTTITDLSGNGFNATASASSPFVSSSFTGNGKLVVNDLPVLNDTVTVTENVTIQIRVNPNVFDTVTITENIALSIPLPVNVFDTVTITENVSLSVIAAGAITLSVYEMILVSDFEENLIPNPSFEVGTTGWAAYSNGGTFSSSISRVTSTSYIGTACLQMVGSGASGNHFGASVTITGLTVGAAYVVSCYVKGNAGGEQFSMYPSNPYLSSPSTITLTTSWQRYTVYFRAASTSAIIYPRVSTPLATFFIDAVQLEPGDTAGTYIDGANGATWTGTANNSISLTTKNTVKTYINTSISLSDSVTITENIGTLAVVVTLLPQAPNDLTSWGLRVIDG